MSLFLRLWLVATVTAFASAATAVMAFAVIHGQARDAEVVRQAVTLARVAAHGASMDPLSELHGEPGRALMRQRAAELMAVGSLLSVAIVERDGAVVADLASPGLEEEGVLRMAPALLTEAARSGARQVRRQDDVIYVAQPLIDQAEHVRGAIALELPVHVLRREGDGVIVFAAVAATIAAVLGLLAALILTNQVAWPIRRLAELAGRLDDAAYDTSIVAPLIGRPDEVGQLARVMLRLVQALDHVGRQMDEIIERRVGRGAGD